MSEGDEYRNDSQKRNAVPSSHWLAKPGASSMLRGRDDRWLRLDHSIEVLKKEEREDDSSDVESRIPLQHEVIMLAARWGMIT